MFGMPPKTTPEELAKLNGLYIEALQDLDPRHLTAAVKRWLKDGDRFPKPADLRKIAAGFAEADADKAEAAKRAIANGTDPGSALRNEAIQLLGDFDLVMRRTLDASSPEYAVLLAECARWWQDRRPPDERDQRGMPVSGYEVARRKRLLPKFGREIEAFAAAGLNPVPEWNTPETAA